MILTLTGLGPSDLCPIVVDASLKQFRKINNYFVSKCTDMVPRGKGFTGVLKMLTLQAANTKDMLY